MTRNRAKSVRTNRPREGKVLSAARVAEYAFEAKAELEDGDFAVLSIEFAERVA